MAVRVIMPQMGLTMTEGKIVRWHKEEGEKVKKGEPLLEIMTEKIVTEVESSGDGILAKVFSAPEDVVPVTQVIGVLVEEGEDAEAVIKEIEAELAAAKAGAGEEAAPAEAPTAAVPAAAPREEAAAEPGSRLKISPLARRIAGEKGLTAKELQQVAGTGPGGRIVKKDILTFIEKRGTAPFTAPVEEERVEPLNDLRKTIASRMTQSWTTPHFYLETEVDAGALQEMRLKVNEVLKKEEIRVTVTDLLVKIVAYVLSQYRYMNSSYSDAGIVYKPEINPGVAVALEDGLIVPVVRNADKKGIREISRTNRELIGRAREGRLTLEDVTGGTFTISNMGMFPVDAFTAIINPPECGILAIGRVVDKPVCINGEIKIRPCMRITLGVDHRVIDGAQGAAFLEALKEAIENPYLVSI